MATVTLSVAQRKRDELQHEIKKLMEKVTRDTADPPFGAVYNFTEAGKFSSKLADLYSDVNLMIEEPKNA